MAKKRKLSSLGALELQSAYNSLLKLKRNIVHEESDEDPNESAPEGFERQVDKTLSLLGSKLEGPKLGLELRNSFRFAHSPQSPSPESCSITMENLTKLNITFTAFLYLKPNPEERIAATTSLGQNELWSSANLYRHLHLLESLIPRTTEASSRAWIEAFFFRASAMLPPNKRMVLNMEHVVQATTTSPSSLSSLSGFVDYTAVVASQCDAAIFMKTPQLHVLKRYMPSGFFVVEAKVFNISDHVPQAVCEMYACGKLLQKNVLRGALTNGHDWIFLLIELNDDYDGASYKQSDVIQLETTKRLDGSLEIHRPWPDLIAAILSHWIENGFAELGSDDWFGVHESTAV